MSRNLSSLPPLQPLIKGTSLLGPAHVIPVSKEPKLLGTQKALEPEKQSNTPATIRYGRACREQGGTMERGEGPVLGATLMSCPQELVQRGPLA